MVLNNAITDGAKWEFVLSKEIVNTQNTRS
jgi:hypothetical protein